MKKLCIIGANEFQNKLVLKAKELGFETHVFAWEDGAVAKKNCDFFYPISITKKEEILKKCKEIKIDAVCSIASDLAMLTVNYIAKKLNLIGNSLECTEMTTNKYEMRKKLIENNLPCPWFKLIEELEDLEKEDFKFPLIVKPIDRSGSRGINKVKNIKELTKALKIAKEVSFSNKVLVEEFIEGNEYSVECISQDGRHKLLQITRKYTTGSPNFIETGHIQPCDLKEEMFQKVEEIIINSLKALEIKNGASHSEIKIYNNEVKIIEIGARMGGDFIGSDMVKYSTGIDFLELVIKVASNEKINIEKNQDKKNVMVKFIFNEQDFLKFNKIKKEYHKNLVEYFINESFLKTVTDSSSRNGYYILVFEKNIELKDLIAKERLV